MMREVIQKKIKHFLRQDYELELDYESCTRTPHDLALQVKLQAEAMSHSQERSSREKEFI